jgi:hypothetical protein
MPDTCKIFCYIDNKLQLFLKIVFTIAHQYENYYFSATENAATAKKFLSFALT